jgi:hypothetical protein
MLVHFQIARKNERHLHHGGRATNSPLLRLKGFLAINTEEKHTLFGIYFLKFTRGSEEELLRVLL